MASAVAIPVPGLKEFPAGTIPLVGLKELPAEQSDVAVKGVPLADHLKELPASPSVAIKVVPLAGHLKELPAEQSVAIKGDPLAGVVVKEVAANAAPSVPEKPAASTPRLVITKGSPSRRDDDDNNMGITTEKPIGKDIAVADDRHRALSLSAPKLFSTDSHALDMMPMKLSHLLELMGGRGAASGTFSGYGWWVSKEDDDALQLKVAMPGLGKEHVKVSAEKNILVIKGEGDKDGDGDSKGPVKYNRRFQLPAEAFKMDQIKAEMNNGVLKVTLPKIKDEERKDVFQIKVE